MNHKEKPAQQWPEPQAHFEVLFAPAPTGRLRIIGALACITFTLLAGLTGLLVWQVGHRGEVSALLRDLPLAFGALAVAGLIGFLTDVPFGLVECDLCRPSLDRAPPASAVRLLGALECVAMLTLATLVGGVGYEDQRVGFFAVFIAATFIALSAAGLIQFVSGVPFRRINGSGRSATRQTMLPPQD
ncbi:hypothetical protein SAMN02745857_03626 [Andreprevotia lacus DSM 23236]|uniref:Uncharacterized protein n=1 Tax=Andreprevotia lacus DSM 23236 TaxID=1121001 RepID=A0A1W1XZ10_9NEIS|nr:hypothetical protein [Andreprevotia lacus]SMC29132.1 hypothetical protein SAMN02745857_03626 [Andreprevotia lacus DSM 23236]